jgi:ribosomal protein S6--L-glutamate ligase
MEEASSKKVACDVISPLDCQLVIDGEKSHILHGSQILEPYDVVLPRIGTSITAYGLAVVKHFESLSRHVVNHSQAIAQSRDKLRCLQVLTDAGVKVPRTVLVRNSRNLNAALQAVGQPPVILKILQGTQGVGVMLAHTPVAIGSVIDTLRGLGQDVLVQQFLVKGAGKDYRAFVVGDEVVAAMERVAPEGEFRSNIHRGGEGRALSLPQEFQKAAVRAAQILGLQIAGVDLMWGDQGEPVVIEVNSSPGFQGIEKATGANIAGFVLDHLIKQAKKPKPR